MFFLQATPSWFSGIDAIDRKLFFLVNADGSNRFFDAIMPFLREANTWMPLYLFLLVFCVMNFGKKGWLWFIFFLCTAGLCDIVSSQVLKQLIIRVRPCNNPELAARIHVLASYRPQSSSFTSSHATTHFGMAMFIVKTLQPYTSKWLKLFFVWAGVIAYAQVYVGVHYPIDVFCGALLGCGLGLLLAGFFNNYVGLLSLGNKLA